jgi:hypothetical protein
MINQSVENSSRVGADPAPDARRDPAVRAQGTCFGFELYSTIPFRCLRNGSGRPLEVRDSPTVQVGDPGAFVGAWEAGAVPSVFARLYRDDQVYRLWTRSSGWILIEPQIPRITLPPFDDPARSEENLWNIPIALCLLHRGDLALHAAAIEINGNALMLVAPGGSGKTTLAAAFAQAGYRVLSEDVTCITIDGQPAIVPGPAMLRLRPDVMSSVELPHADVLRRLPSRITMALSTEDRGNCSPVPLRGIIMLHTAAAEFRLEQIPAVEAVPAIWPLTFMMPADEWKTFCFTRLVDLVKVVPVWRFERPLKFGTLPETVRRLAVLCSDGRP